MFTQKTVILSFLDNDSYLVQRISHSSKKAVVKQQKQYQAIDYSALFIQIKKDFKTNSIRVLLPENKSYTLFSLMPKSESITRDLALSIAKSSVPEDLDNSSFDYKIISEDKENYHLQIIAASSSLISSLLESASKVGLNITAFEPVSSALSRLTTNNPQPHLIAYQNYFVASFQGVVYGISVGGADKLKLSVKKSFDLDLTDTITGPLEPALGLALKSDLKGQDSQVLNLQTQADFSESKNNKKNILYILFLIIAPVGLILFWFLYFNKNKKEEPFVDLLPPSPSITINVPTDSDKHQEKTELDRSQVKIQILNGSGISGQAALAKDQLEDLGYQGIATGNAGSYDYTDTIISSKDDFKNYLSILTSALSPTYTVSNNSQIHDINSDFDIIIIIGQPKNE